MGMAASQARLLMLTARLHDVEHEAQSIQHAKLQLATQQDEAYENYQRALDAVSLTFASTDPLGNRSTIVANYNNLFSINAANVSSGNHYILLDNRGRVVVSDDIYEGYHDFIGTSYNQNAYNFAMYMIYGPDFDTNQAQGGHMAEIMNQIVTEINNNANDEGDQYLVGLLEDLGFSAPINTTNLSTILRSNDSANLMNYFFQTYGLGMFNENDWSNQDVEDFNYYVRIFNAIQHYGDCIAISDFDGYNGSAATNSEWLTAMLQSGMMTISMFNDDNTISGTTVNSDSALSYTTTTQIDKTALAKAEAEYEHTLKIIDRKDKKFDLQLNKLETERSALTKQYDSVKKVVDDNIERTFGIFS